MSRGGFKINKVSDSDSYESSKEETLPSWLELFANKIKNNSTTAVEAARQRDANSFYDQISAIVSKKPAHSSVEEKVREYQNKIGLQEYLRRVSQNETSYKVAQQPTQLPESFNKLTEKDRQDIITFVRNKCETHHGNIQVPALVEDVKQTFRQRGVQPQDVNDKVFEKFISDEIIRAKKMNPSAEPLNNSLGKGVGLEQDFGTDNQDFFANLLPVKK